MKKKDQVRDVLSKVRSKVRSAFEVQLPVLSHFRCQQPSLLFEQGGPALSYHVKKLPSP